MAGRPSRAGVAARGCCTRGDAGRRRGPRARSRLNEFTPRIADFGLAKLRDDDDNRTATGAVFGTPQYMAPEQAAGRTDAIGPATDVYALGVILYELLAGRTPFDGATAADVARRVAAEEPRPPRRARRDVPRDLDAVCLKCLAKEPARRYATAGALAEELARFLGGRPTVARPLSGAGRAARWCRRRKGALAFVALGCVLAVAIGLGLWSARPSAVAAPPLRPVSQAGDLQLRQAQYVLAIRQAGAFWGEGRLPLIRESLAPWQSSAGRDDLRDFAWYWLWARDWPPRVLRCPETVPKTMAFSADGTRLLAGTWGGALHRWQVFSGQPLPAPRLRDPVSGDWRPAAAVQFRPLYSYAFAPATHRLAAFRSDDKADIVTVWNPDKSDDPPLATHRWTRGSLYNLVALSPDGKRVALSGPNRLILWNWANDEMSETPLANEPLVSSLCFAPDGKTVAVACLHGPLASPREVWCQLHDTATGKMTARLPGLHGCVWYLAWSPDGKTLVSGGDGVEVCLWDVKSRQKRLIPNVPGGKPWEMALSPDGRTLAVSTEKSGHHVLLYEVATGARRPEEFAVPATVKALPFSPDGATVAVGCEDRSVHLWEPWGARPFLSLRDRGLSEAWSVTFLGDTGNLAAAGESPVIRLWDARAGEAGAGLSGHGALVSCLAFNPQKGLIASGGFDKKVCLWDVKGRLAARLDGHAQDIRCLAFSPDGNLLATGTGTYVAGVVRGGELRLWDVESRREKNVSLHGHTAKVRAVAFSPDGKTLYSASEDGTARVWDVGTGRLLRTLPHPAEVWCLAISPDGRTLVTGDGKGTGRFWDVETGKEVHTKHYHSRGVRAVAFSPDGKTLATGGMDRTIRLWQAATGQELLTFPNQPHDVNSLAFSPDGTALAAALHDGSVRVWQAPRTEK